MNCSDIYGEDWGDVTGEKREVMEAAISASLSNLKGYLEWAFSLTNTPIPQANDDHGDDAA